MKIFSVLLVALSAALTISTQPDSPLHQNKRTNNLQQFSLRMFRLGQGEHGLGRDAGARLALIGPPLESAFQSSGCSAVSHVHSSQPLKL